MFKMGECTLSPFARLRNAEGWERVGERVNLN